MAQSFILVPVDFAEGDKAIIISKEAMKKCTTLDDMVGGLGDNVGPIPVKKITKKILLKIVTWLEWFAAQPWPEETLKEEEKPVRVLEPWETEFFNAITEDDDLVNIINGANWAGAKVMVDALAIHVASWVKGQSPEELRKVLERTNKVIPQDLQTAIPNVMATKVEEQGRADDVKRKREDEEGGD